MDNTKEYIICAAIKRKYTKRCLKNYSTEYQDIYKIELGYRHSDIIIKFYKQLELKMAAQGFFTSKGRFVSREEAAIIAFNCGQIPKQVTCLFSEDLY